MQSLFFSLPILIVSITQNFKQVIRYYDKWRHLADITSCVISKTVPILLWNNIFFLNCGILFKDFWMQCRWAFVGLKLFLFSPLPLFLILVEKVCFSILYISFSSKTIFFSVLACLSVYHFPTYVQLHKKHVFSLLLILIVRALIFSLALLKMKKILHVIWLY